MRRSARTILILLALSAGSGCASDGGGAGADPATPLELARRGTHADSYHGTAIPDPYRWMEDLESEETRAWVRSRDRRARAYAASHARRDSFARALGTIASVEVTGPAVERGGHLFQARFPATGPQREGAILYRERPDAPEEILLDPETTRAEWGVAPTRFWPDPGGRRVAVTLARDGGIWETLRIFDIASRTFLPDSLPDIHGQLSTVTWQRDGRGFFYERFVRAAGVAGQVADGVIHLHRLGEPASADRGIYAPPAGEGWFTAHTAKVEDPWVVILERRGTDPGHRVLLLDRDRPGAPRVLVGEPEAAYQYAGAIGDTLFFRTDRGAPGGRVVATVAAGEGPPTWREVVPEADAAISTWSGTVPVGVQVVGGELLVTYVEDGVWTPRRFSSAGAPLGDLFLPYVAPIWSGFVGDPSSGDAYYVLQGLADPGTVYRLDVASGRSTPFVRPDLPYDASGIVTEHVTVPGPDGAAIPTFVVRRRDTPLDGSAPLVLYGYGFAGWNAAPYFYPAMTLWVARGGIWAVTTPRGDGGFGTAWHLAGQRRNKPNGISDYLAAADWLVGHGYTSRDRLVANGSSAGGPLVAGAVVRAPDAFAAMILDYPLVDVLRYHEFGSASRWASEYGTSDDPADFAVLSAYSPYHRIERGCYPATLLAPGENDSVTPPSHAYKLGSALEWAQTCDRPVLIRTSWGAGHAAGADVPRSIENWADQIAFLDLVLPGSADRARR